MSTPTPPAPKRRVLVPTLVAGATLILGLTIGSATAKSDAPAPAPTATVTVTRTPQSCLDAIDHGDQIIGWSSDASKIAGDSFQAIADSDYDRIPENTAKINRLSEKVRGVTPDYHAEKADCASR